MVDSGPSRSLSNIPPRFLFYTMDCAARRRGVAANRRTRRGQPDGFRAGVLLV